MLHVLIKDSSGLVLSRVSLGMRVGVIRGLLALACIYFEVRGSSECNLYDESVRS